MENILYPLLSFIPAVLNLGILAYLVFFVPRNKTTDVFSFFVLALILWQAEDTVVRLCSTAETARFWDRVLCIGWAGFAPIAFHFSTRYTALKSFYTRFALVGVYLPFALLYLFYIASGSPTIFDHQEGWGWIIKPRSGTLDGFQRILISAYVIATVFILFRYAFKIRSNKRKRFQAFLIASGMFIPAVQGIITQIVYPVILDKPDIPVTSTFMTIFSVATILSIRKYKLFNISESVNVETVLSGLKNIVFVVSPKRQIIYANPYAEDIFLTGKLDDGNFSVKKIFPAGEYFSAFTTEAFKPALQGKPVRNYATVFETPSGKKIDVLLSAELITSNNQVQGLLLVANDVTELSRTLKDLESTNKELERFAYISSHDLQEPLRKVSNFLHLLEMRYKHQLDGTAQKYINVAVNCAGQMRQLIQDLLEYSHIAATEENRGTTNMNEIVKMVFQTLALQIEESGAKNEFDPLPILHRTDRMQMHQLIQNLVSNALKYRGDKKPHLKILATDEGEYWRFAVKDNGIGIDPQYHEKIFVVFQRLHSKSQYPGTGVGLAICKKIVEQHGGRIWVESQPGSGSTFFFTMPKYLHARQPEIVGHSRVSLIENDSASKGVFKAQ